MKIYLVGGAVRDKLLGLPVKERDWVVVGATPADMIRLGYRQVGKEFPVFLHPSTHEEYALARMERKVNPGYTGFTFDVSTDVTLEDDLKRRDLTINAMAEDVEGHIIDPYGGQRDLQHKQLRHVSQAFSEDPVRILRAGRFLARYQSLGFQMAPETLALMRLMVEKGEIKALVAERVWKELERALGEPHPEAFFQVLSACGALPILFPQLQINGPGIHALQQATTLTPDKAIRFAALLHAYPDEQDRGNFSIPWICERYRAPNEFRQLVSLTHRHYQMLFNITELAAEEILSMFSSIDIFRRDARFEQLLIACDAIAQSQSRALPIEQIKDLARVTKSIDVKALVAEGWVGSKLALKLKEERIKVIERCLGPDKP